MITRPIYSTILGLSLLTAASAHANIVQVNCPDPTSLVFAENQSGGYSVAANSIVTSQNDEPSFVLEGITQAGQALALTNTFYERDYLRCTYGGLIGGDVTSEIIIETPKSVPYPTLSYCTFINEPGTKSCSSITITDQPRDCTLRCESL